MVVLSALAGYLFAAGGWDSRLLLVCAGIGLLAGGCSALNQWQEKDLDARMQRTRQRPLPAGLMSTGSVLVLAAIQIGGGLFLLSQLPAALPALLGFFALIWYNGVYTPLKRLTPFAALPGALCGALPPLIGWTAAGADLSAQKALILAGTLFVWQIPHTWLLLCHYREDLKRSGLPDLFRTIPTPRLLRINNFWIASLFLSYMLFPLFNFISHSVLEIFFICGQVLLFLVLIKTSRNNLQQTSRQHFHLINLSMALLFTVLIMDRIPV